jgi:hypothetical protein
MPDGKKWDEGPAAAAKTATQSGPLATWLRAHPEVDGAEGMLGDPALAPGVLEDARKSDAPDPVAFLEVGRTIVRTPLQARSFQPAWGFAFVVELMPDTSDTLRLAVYDWDGPEQLEAIGTHVMPARALIGPERVRELPRFGNVAKLTLLVEPAAPSNVEKRLAVPGKPTWTETGLEVLAGQSLTIEASGQVCTGGDKCDYPDGQPAPHDKNEKGFESRGHGALIGAIGDTRFFVGRERRIVAPASGRLVLGVNDRDTDNNSGRYDVRVRVETLAPAASP